MNKNNIFIFAILAISAIAILIVVFPVEEEPCRIIDRSMPDLEGGPHWTVYIDNLSTPENEAFVIWEGYEGDYMEINLYVPQEGHRYRVIYVGSTE